MTQKFYRHVVEKLCIEPLHIQYELFCRVLYTPRMSYVIPMRKWRKGSQWIDLVRNNAKVVAYDDVVFLVFKRLCKLSQNRYMPLMDQVCRRCFHKNGIIHIDNKATMTRAKSMKGTMYQIAPKVIIKRVDTGAALKYILDKIAVCCVITFKEYAIESLCLATNGFSLSFITSGLP
uniref:Glycosyl transferase, family 14 n=1 Tax=Tanacetum cinerariifolium TaxID=118510 RepID=A0A6L2K9Y9_TANCI|nr:glycosyl transferase, family 14 [Tanacetum cinerariifolium]